MPSASSRGSSGSFVGPELARRGRSNVRPRLNSAVRALFGDYSIYVIYKSSKRPGEANSGLRTAGFAEISSQSVVESPDASLRDRAWYCGEGCITYGVHVEGQLVSACWYWFGDRYALRNYWPLSELQAKLVEVYTADPYRGRGLATALIRSSAHDMHSRGFLDLFARVWHSNRPSRRAFAAAGWEAHRLVVDIRPFGRPMRMTLPPWLPA